MWNLSRAARRFDNASEFRRMTGKEILWTGFEKIRRSGGQGKLLASAAANFLVAIILKFDFAGKVEPNAAPNLSYLPASGNNGCRSCSIFHGVAIRITAARSCLNASSLLCIPHLCILYPRASSRSRKIKAIGWLISRIERTRFTFVWTRLV